jgi:general secretion pathway protein H
MPSRSAGFTLIELLVVMLIIGIMATTLTLSLTPDTHRTAEDEAWRFARVLEQAVDAAELGQPLALVWSSDGYAFRELDDDGRWQAPTDAFFAPHRWPDGISSEAVTLYGAAQPAGRPLWLVEQGQARPYALVLRAGERLRRVQLSPLGKVSVGAPS